MNFKEFIQQHESQALKVDIQKSEPLAYREYLGKKLLLENADFESEKKEVIEEIKDAVTYFKKHILNFIKYNSHCKVEYIGKPAPYIMHLRFYLMYKELHSYNGELSQKPELSLIENDKESDTALQTKIKLHFDFFQKNCPRKHKQILKDEDFEKLIKWTTMFFENDLKVPEIDEPIIKVSTNKTYVQGAFKALFNELRPSSTYPINLFELYKNAFKPYANDTKDNFDKARINHEVYKIMNIEY